MEASNVQKMREAFDEIIEKIDAWRTDGTMEHWQYSQLFDIADAALALPLRQCDVGTAEEQAQRFEKFCKKSSMSGFGASAYCAYECACKDGSCCEFAWAQMPYEAEEGAGK